VGAAIEAPVSSAMRSGRRGSATVSTKTAPMSASRIWRIRPAALAADASASVLSPCGASKRSP
jgi:hypothetical protein